MTGSFWRRFAYYVLPTLLWMSLMFSASTDAGSAEHTQPVVGGLLRRFFPFIAIHLTPEQVGRVDWNLRKTAHVTEYAILSILLFRSIAFGNPRFRSRNVILPLLMGVLHAAGDEFHQSFVPSRGASTTDVFFDSTGVLIGLTLCLWRHCVQQIRKGPDSN